MDRCAHDSWIAIDELAEPDWDLVAGADDEPWYADREPWMPLELRLRTRREELDGQIDILYRRYSSLRERGQETSEAARELLGRLRELTREAAAKERERFVREFTIDPKEAMSLLDQVRAMANDEAADVSDTTSDCSA